MTKQNMLFSFFLLVSSYCLSQTGLPNDILIITPDTTNGGLVPRKMIATADGGFLTAGSNGLQGYLLRASASGQEMWTKFYQFGDETDLNSLIEHPSGEIYAVGTCLNCVPADATQKVLVLKTDAQGALLRDTTFGRSMLHAQGHDLVLTTAQKIAVTGQVVIASGLAPTNAFLTVLDDQLHSDFWTEHHELAYDLGKALVQTSDGGYAIAGWSVASLTSSRQAQVFRTDAAGSLLWKHSIPHLSSEFIDIVQAADGRIIALGDRQVDTVNGRDVYLAVFDDATGNLLDEKTYGSVANDEGKSLEKIEDGYLVGAVYGEPSQQYWSLRDWVFWLDEQFVLQDQYFRDGYLFGHFLVNAIPLSCTGRSFAFHSMLAFFTARSIQFFKRSYRGDRATLTQAPQNDQLVPRDLLTNKGQVVFAGSLPASDTYDEMRLQVWRENVLQQVLYDDSPQNFSFTISITAELANYHFILSGRQGQEWCLESEAHNVVAGDAYLIQGQSNAVAGLPYDPDNNIDHAYRHHTSSFVRNFGLKNGSDNDMIWHREISAAAGDYADNISGQWGLLLGKSIVDKYGIPVAIINGAVSGISIDSLSPPTERYDHFVERVERSGLRNHLRAILMFQGETNAGGAFYDSANKYFQKFQTLDNAWRQDFPALQQRYLFQIRPGAYWIGATLSTCLQIAEAQRRVAEMIPNWQIMSTTGMNHDSTHYFYPNGYERAGNDMYRLVARDLYGAPPSANIHPPTVDALRFSNCDRREITLTLRHAADTYTWTPDWESDFRLEGATSVSITSGQVLGNTVVLNLSAAPGPGFTGLSYTSHPGGSEAPVKNANGIGMLMFYNLPVSPYDLSASTMVTNALCFGAADGSAEVAVSGGSPGYSYLWSHGVTNSQVNNLPAGVYTVTVTDAKDCTLVETVVVEEPPLQTESMELSICAGDTIVLFGQVYTSAGVYQLNLTGPSGCPLLLTLTLTVLPTPQSTDTVRLCAGASHTLPDGTVITASGTYNLVLESALGCDSLVALVVEIFDPILLVNINVTPDSGMASGSITVTVGGGWPPYNYAWSTGATTPTASNLSAGTTYTLTVSDALGCSAVFPIVVTVGTADTPFDLEVALFPNPCVDHIFLRVPELQDAGEYRIVVTDWSGRAVLPVSSLSGAMLRMDTAGLPQGSYLVRVMEAGVLRWAGVFVKN